MLGLPKFFCYLCIVEFLIFIVMNEYSFVLDVLSVLVTVLITWQIIQYIFARSQMRQIAENVARSVAEKEIQSLTSDIDHIFRGIQ